MGNEPLAANHLTAIVAAMPEEVAPLHARMRTSRRHRLRDAEAVEGLLGNAEVVLVTTGDGAKRAEAGLRALLKVVKFDRLLVVGVSGALSPELTPGMVIVARQVWHRNETLPAPDSAWVEQALEGEEALSGVVVTTDRILSTAASKSEALGALATSEPAAVDLESAVYAGIAHEHGIPYLVVRSICDTAEEELPLDLNDCLDESGGVSRVKVVLKTMRRPGLIAKLLGLRMRVHRAADGLAALIPDLLAGELP